VDALGPWHIIIIVAFVAILFGAKRLPDAARSLGRSARIMKSEMKGLHEEPAVAESPVAVSPAPPEAVVPALADEVPIAARHDGSR
jgi:sec-independent protein translocase protein TatA